MKGHAAGIFISMMIALPAHADDLAGKSFSDLGLSFSADKVQLFNDNGTAKPLPLPTDGLDLSTVIFEGRKGRFIRIRLPDDQGWIRSGQIRSPGCKSEGAVAGMSRPNDVDSSVAMGAGGGLLCNEAGQ